MILGFFLSMPHAASWNGKWTGEGKCYAIIRKFGDSTGQRILDGNPYAYHWPDGWCAKVEVRKLDGLQSRKLRKESQGFCGYQWMVNSIFLNGKILADHEVNKGVSV